MPFFMKIKPYKCRVIDYIWGPCVNRKRCSYVYYERSLLTSLPFRLTTLLLLLQVYVIYCYGIQAFCYKPYSSQYT